MGTLIQDTRYALRVLRKNPGFTVVALLTLTLGIGGNVVIFSVVDAVLLRPLPYEDPEGLVFLWGMESGEKTGSNWNSWPDAVDFEERNDVFAGVASLSLYQPTLTVPGLEPQRVAATRVTHDLLPMLGFVPARGRGFLPEEDRPGGEPVVVLGHGLAADLLGGRDPLGAAISVDGTPHTVVGVMPQGVDFPGGRRLWVPAGPTHTADDRGMHRLLTIARLAPGVDLERADANVKAIAAALEAEHPETNHDRAARVEPVHETFTGAIRPSLIALFAAVGLVLLIACANVAGLLVARGAARGREMAVRAAIGAGPGRLLRQLLTESVILGLIGGVCGLLFAIWGLDLLVSLAPATLPRIDAIALNGRVLAFSAALALSTGVAFGLAPALRGRRRDLQMSLKEGGRGFFAGGARFGLRQALVVGEVALAFVVVAGAGLVGNSLMRLQRVDPGFDGSDVLSARVALPEGAYPDWREATRFFADLVERLQRIPGVVSAAAGYQHPLAGGWETSFELPGVFEAPAGQRPEARILPVTPGYFETVGMRLVAGRAFDDRDDENAPGAVVINEAFARRFFPGGDAVGHRLVRNSWWEGLGGEYTIVGVVADVKMDGLASGTPWAMYYPHKQVPFQDMYVFVRGSVRADALADAVRAAVWEADPNLPVEEFATLGTLRGGSLAQQRFQAGLLGLFATVALALAAIGIYGVLAASVAARRGEIGVRMALGASPSAVLRGVFGQGFRLAVAGLTIGLVAVLLLTRLIAGLLYEISPTDPATLAAMALFFALVAVLACLVPAARATRLDPVEVLRAE